MPNNHYPEHSHHAPPPQTPPGTGANSLQQPETEQQRLERLSHEVQALKQTSELDGRKYRREVGQLRGRLGLLTGVSLAAIAILVTVATWLGLSLKLEQRQLAEQVRSVTAEKRVGTEQIESLEGQISALQQQARALTQQAPEAFASELRGVQAQLQNLETQIREMVTDVNEREQIINTLERTLENLNKEESSKPPNPASDSNAPDPASKPN